MLQPEVNKMLVRYCGNMINRKTYRPWLVSCLVYTMILFSVLLVAVGVVAFMMSSDWIKQTDYTICSVDYTLNELFDGTAEGVTPTWSGVDNFNEYASQIATNHPNVMPTLA